MMGSLHEAEDLTQETFLKAWRAFDSFQGRGSLKAWLYQIATRVCLDALRQRKHARRLLPRREWRKLKIDGNERFLHHVNLTRADDYPFAQ